MVGCRGGGEVGMGVVEWVGEWMHAVVWSFPMVVLLLGTGCYVTVCMKFFPVVRLWYVLRQTIGGRGGKKGGSGEVSAFRAVSTALAATLGSGNIVGVATAIAIGGPGAIFWIWVTGVFGMGTKFVEVVLAVYYRRQTGDGRFVGGPMYYLKDGVGVPGAGVLASLFCIFSVIASFGIGNMTQSNSVALVFEDVFCVDVRVTGAVLMVLVGLVSVGGLKSISWVTGVMVPGMAILYVCVGVVLVCCNMRQLVPVCWDIVSGAFAGTAAVGGFAGSVVRQAIAVGISRGVAVNEAGLGTAPIAHAAAITDHPVRQGLWGIFEVFVGTMVVSSVTAFAILLTGVWQGGASGAALTVQSFERGLPFGIGQYVVGVSVPLFAFTTMLGWLYYGERCAEFLCGPRVCPLYRAVWLPFVYVGAVGSLSSVWNISDAFNGLMALPNLVGLLFLARQGMRLREEFFAQQEG
ncbi:alanine/glycine:cation symporter family protein [Treponema paraluiscuniculi]|uniref:alanine/glycine:cation symporter family protein n=1 Tax=Treponema paraluiscuniculi TaxID=53435 RepID=UPI001FE010CD|nr:AGCS family amino acid carrier protein [Treponema paraluiscuniculi]